MRKTPDKNEWVYVIIRDPEGHAMIAGIHDHEKEIDFIPVFKEKKEADHGLLNLPLERGVKFEVQAVIMEDLAKDAVENGFLLFFMGNEGVVHDIIDPNAFIE